MARDILDGDLLPILPSPEELWERANAQRVLQEEKLSPKNVGNCIICDGNVVEKITTLYPSVSDMIIGPGSAGQIQKIVEGYYCKDCGICYEFPPKNNK